MLPVPEDIYATHAELIESVISAACRSHRLLQDQGEEFRSWARLKLLANDRAILRKFAGRSSLRTYLVTVVERLYLDWRNYELGKWRPSSEARRLGEVAVELERMVGRDGWSFAEAADALVARGLAPGLESCERTWARLPRLPRRRRVDEAELDTVAAPDPAPDPIEQDESRARSRKLVSALERAVAELPEADRVALRLRYWSGIKVSQIALIVGEEQKALYRRFERLWALLRQRLEAEGLTGADLDALQALWEPGGGDD